MGNSTIEYDHVLTIASAPGFILSFALLKAGKPEFAGNCVLFYMHCCNFSAGVTQAPIVALYALMLFPNFAFFLASSTRVRVFNTLLISGQYVHHVIKTQDMFKVTLTEEQGLQIYMLYAAALVCLGSLCISCLIQKEIETNLWNVAQANYQKSERLTKEAVQAAAAKDAFVSSLSHEIRNPLNSMTGSINYLIEAIQDPHYLRILKNARLSGEILLNLVNNVLDAAKLKSDKMELSYLETSFPSIVKKVLRMNAENLKDRGITAQAYISSKLPKELYIDPSRMLQIVMNLMSNAVKFTPQGGRINIFVDWCSEHEDKKKLASLVEDYSLENRPSNPLTEASVLHDLTSAVEPTSSASNLTEEFNSEEASIRRRNIRSLRQKSFKANQLQEVNNSARAMAEEPFKIFRVNSRRQIMPFEAVNQPEPEPEGQEKKGYLKVQVSDSGCGVDPENIPKLFNMFTQAHRGVAPIYGGTGLGLWICKQLCEKMGGDIDIYSKPHKGTSFVFYIPVNNDGLDDSRGPVERRRADKVNVLIVDDYGYNRDLHKLLLEQEGVHVVLAGNGQEGVERYQSYEEDYFAFILMDVQMPVMDGFTAAKVIRDWENRESKKKVDIYFVSGEYYNEEEVMIGFNRSTKMHNERTGIRFLRKPIDIEIIRNVLNRYRRGSGAGEENNEIENQEIS